MSSATVGRLGLPWTRRGDFPSFRIAAHQPVSGVVANPAEHIGQPDLRRELETAVEVAGNEFGQDVLKVSVGVGAARYAALNESVEGGPVSASTSLPRVNVHQRLQAGWAARGAAVSHRSSFRLPASRPRRVSCGNLR